MEPMRHCHLQLGGSLWSQESSQADRPRPRAWRHMVGLWLWGRMPGMQAALQLNPSLNSATALFQAEHFGLIMWAFFHLNLVTQEYFQPAHCHKSLVSSRDKEETRKKLLSKLFEATLGYGFPQGAGLQQMFLQLFDLNITAFKPARCDNCGFCPLTANLNLQRGKKEVFNRNSTGVTTGELKKL